MKIAVIENDKVVNVINGELKTAKKMFAKVVQETKETRTAWIGARFKNGKFEPLSPYPSWTFDEETFEYYPPIPKPEGDYSWNEEKGDWLPRTSAQAIFGKSREELGEATNNLTEESVTKEVY